MGCDGLGLHADWGPRTPSARSHLTFHPGESGSWRVWFPESCGTSARACSQPRTWVTGSRSFREHVTGPPCPHVPRGCKDAAPTTLSPAEPQTWEPSEGQRFRLGPGDVLQLPQPGTCWRTQCDHIWGQTLLFNSEYRVRPRGGASTPPRGPREAGPSRSSCCRIGRGPLRAQVVIVRPLMR